MFLNTPITNIDLFYGSLNISFYTQITKIIIIFLSIICTLISYNYILSLKDIILEFIIIYLLCILGMCFLLNSGDFIMLFYL